MRTITTAILKGLWVRRRDLTREMLGAGFHKYEEQFKKRLQHVESGTKTWRHRPVVQIENHPGLTCTYKKAL